MRVRAQMGMVMNLDKCIGCHTCSVTCKNVWTNRRGTEYVWFNNVETKPGRGYPRDWEDQERYRGGWTLDRKGRLKLKAGGRLQKALNIFHNPDLPAIDDYYDANPAAPDKTYARRGGFLPAVTFDPMEYGIPPNNLSSTDSSQLLSLVVAPANRLFSPLASVIFPLLELSLTVKQTIMPGDVREPKHACVLFATAPIMPPMCVP